MARVRGRRRPRRRGRHDAARRGRGKYHAGPPLAELRRATARPPRAGRRRVKRAVHDDSRPEPTTSSPGSACGALRRGGAGQDARPASSRVQRALVDDLAAEHPLDHRAADLAELGDVLVVGAGRAVVGDVGARRCARAPRPRRPPGPPRSASLEPAAPGRRPSAGAAWRRRMRLADAARRSASRRRWPSSGRSTGRTTRSPSRRRPRGGGLEAAMPRYAAGAAGALPHATAAWPGDAPVRGSRP